MRTLSRFVAKTFGAIDQSLSTLECQNAGISQIDLEDTILAVLLARTQAPFAEEWLREYHLSSHRAKCSARSSGSCGGEKATLNIAICHRLTHVNLRGNLLQDIVGVVMFQNVKSLNLADNNIHTIAACEPLSVLEHLEVLFLSGNPVARLLHYRSHMVKICSTVGSHTESAFRTKLRLLDGQQITSGEVTESYRRLKYEEAYLVPAMHHIALRGAAESFSKRIDMHAEMRRRGLLFSDASHPLLFQRVMHTCAEVCELNAIHRSRRHAEHTVHQLRLLAVRFSHRVQRTEESENYYIAHASTEACASCLKTLFNLGEKLHASQAELVRWYTNFFSVRINAHSDCNHAQATTLAQDSTRLALSSVRERSSRRVLAACMSMWRNSYIARRHLNTSVLKRVVSRWKLQTHAAVSHTLNTAKAKLFVLRQRFIYWKASYRRSLCLRQANTAGFLLLFNRRVPVLKSALLQMRIRSQSRALLRNYFGLWTAFSLNRQNIRSSRQNSTPQLAMANGNINGVATDSATTRCSVSTQCNFFEEKSSAPLNQQHHKLCEILQLEKLQLLKLVASLETELATNRVQLNKLSTTVANQRAEMDAIIVDRDVAHDGVIAYERERMVHLDLIKQLTLRRQ